MRWNLLGWKTWAAVIVVLIGLLPLAAMIEDPQEPEPERPSNTAACQHFKNVMSDVSAGVLTDTELRDKLKEVRGSAAGDAHIAASAMLSAATRGDGEALADAAEDMRDACR